MCLGPHFLLASYCSWCPARSLHSGMFDPLMGTHWQWGHANTPAAHAAATAVAPCASSSAGFLHYNPGASMPPTGMTPPNAQARSSPPPAEQRGAALAPAPAPLGMAGPLQPPMQSPTMMLPQSMPHAEHDRRPYPLPPTFAGTAGFAPPPMLAPPQAMPPAGCAASLFGQPFAHLPAPQQMPHSFLPTVAPATAALPNPYGGRHGRRSRSRRRSR